MDNIKIDTSSEASHFWNAVKIYYQHPNSINKQVLFSEDVIIAELLPIFTLNECQHFFDNFSVKLLEKSSTKNCLSKAELDECSISQLTDVENVFSNPDKIFLLIRKLLPKLNVNDSYKFFEFIFIDKAAAKVYIFTKSIPLVGNETLNSNIQSKKLLDPYVILKFNFIQLSYSNKYVDIFYQKNFNKKGATWLHAVFSVKFSKLMSSAYKINNTSFNKLQFDNKVNIVQYYKLYEEMKFKYAKYFVESWTENTDPKKYVYEDIGIATYLMMLWNDGNIPEKSSKKQRFIDIGCGNGLLVHILNSEGHLGMGIDIRKRRIWDKYPHTTILKEETVIPSCKSIYPNADWLIGNHSDELTAWIPIMARLSNKHCQYFVLPCCPYQLNGMKFQRKNSSFSSYQDFLNYVKEISKLCDFETYIDKLRIPSTKKVCLIGVRQNEISMEKYSLVNDTIVKFISQECQTFPGQDDYSMGNQKALNFKIRKSVEPVRNCTKLPKEFTDEVLKLVMNELLKEQIICKVIRNEKSFAWNRGRKLPIKELASSLRVDVLKQLKNECKGLQTFLKNHHFIFEVCQGCVQFRSPENMLELCTKYLESQNEKWKLKKCWFYNNHPDQCPLNTDACSYSHYN